MWASSGKLARQLKVHLHNATPMRVTRASLKDGRSVLPVSVVTEADISTGPARSATKKKASAKRVTTSTVSPLKETKRLKKALEPSSAVQKNLLPLQAQAAKVLEILNEHYPKPEVPLNSESPFQLLCAVLLSAQVIMHLMCRSSLLNGSLLLTSVDIGSPLTKRMARCWCRQRI